MKKIVYLLLALVFVLSLPLTAVSAESDPITGMVDEDGDLVVEGLPGVEMTGDAGQALVQQSGQVAVSAGPAPSPEHPVDAILYTKTPQFYFTERSGATRYRVEVKNGYTGVVLYTYTGAANCSSGFCSLKPDTRLKPTALKFLQGKYEWRVRAKVGGFWENYSDPATFGIISTGFSDTFNSGIGKWQAVTGDWTRVDKGYLKTAGVKGIGASALHKQYFLEFNYTVKMKRKLTDAYQGVIVWGNPSSYVPQNGLWYSGVFFLIRNNQTYAIFQMSDGVLTQLKGYTYSPSILAYDWNTLRVDASKPNLHFYINDVYHGYVTPTIDNEGFVGVIAYKNDNTLKEPLLVDSAVLVSDQPIFASLPLDPAMKLDLDPVVVDGME